MCLFLVFYLFSSDRFCLSDILILWSGSNEAWMETVKLNSAFQKCAQSQLINASAQGCN